LALEGQGAQQIQAANRTPQGLGRRAKEHGLIPLPAGHQLAELGQHLAQQGVQDLRRGPKA